VSATGRWQRCPTRLWERLRTRAQSSRGILRLHRSVNQRGLARCRTAEGRSGRGVTTLSAETRGRVILVLAISTVVIATTTALMNRVLQGTGPLSASLLFGVFPLWAFSGLTWIGYKSSRLFLAALMAASTLFWVFPPPSMEIWTRDLPQGVGSALSIGLFAFAGLLVLSPSVRVFSGVQAAKQAAREVRARQRVEEVRRTQK
jgi:hypothetical protein